MNNYIQKLDDLKNGNIQELKVDKHEFYQLREELIKREDFKHFQGIAKQGGDIIYVYLKEPRS
ncbi:hypothetical protein M2M59_04175 [Rummeliibacillus sp. G93]|uniref:hypothetical protein n=1 Tax=Rummeliibacillus TaxID=648802 RepID=UPI00116C69BC|nr:MULTISPECIES: hypothetical protein [Rummeliibacillus]MBB5170056.1 hypothetical protein [Rummeliibacillus stabekisii]UQW98215.1 hypothetical protein M2M59_04175 [Rummeliibacillus sp. G93]GEL04315.1 hypothetical protein RST01_09420 [Rummeliibacillus stabekisii]